MHQPYPRQKIPLCRHLLKVVEICDIDTTNTPDVNTPNTDQMQSVSNHLLPILGTNNTAIRAFLQLLVLSPFDVHYETEDDHT